MDVKRFRDIASLLREAKWLEGKTLAQVSEAITASDGSSRVTTKGHVGYVIENGFFGIRRNSTALPDIEHLRVEIKTCPLEYDGSLTGLRVKEPLSLNIINYCEEYRNSDITESSLYKKNRRILFVFYIHDDRRERSEYLIKYVFLWEMNEQVLNELRPDYNLILEKIRAGRAHDIHQRDHRYLTLCPKHGGTYKDPNCHKSKRPQPFSPVLAEIRAFRLKNKYMDLIISRYLGRNS